MARAVLRALRQRFRNRPCAACPACFTVDSTAWRAPAKLPQRHGLVQSSTGRLPLHLALFKDAPVAVGHLQQVVVEVEPGVQVGAIEGHDRRFHLVVEDNETLLRLR